VAVVYHTSWALGELPPSTDPPLWVQFHELYRTVLITTPGDS